MAKVPKALPLRSCAFVTRIVQPKMAVLMRNNDQGIGVGERGAMKYPDAGLICKMKLGKGLQWDQQAVE